MHKGEVLSLTEEAIDQLSRIENAASPAPWYVREVDDNLCMSAIAVSTEAESSLHEDARGLGEWNSAATVAACLIQSHLITAHVDHRRSENALLIAEMRNHMSELLRLARLGLRVRCP